MTVKKEPAVIKHAFINFSENSVAKNGQQSAATVMLY